MSNMKKIGFNATLSLVIGNIVGVGIFTTTGYAANYLDSVLLIFLLWVFGGVYAISGAVVYGILAKEYPLSGGDFHYLRSEISPSTGYAFGWSAFTITYTGSVAALAIGAAYYFTSLFQINLLNELKIDLFVFNLRFVLNEEKIVAIFLVIIFSWINYRGLILSARFQTILTILILIFIFVFSVVGIISVNNSNFDLDCNANGFDFNNFLTAFIAVIFTFIGWTSAVYIAEEIKDPKVMIPKSLIYGVLAVTILYLMINFLYLYSLPLPEIKNTINIASFVAQELWGLFVASLISFFIFIAVLSTLNSTILSGSRIYMAMSREGYLFGKFAKLHQRYHTPYRAILIQALWSILLIFSGTFNQLLSFVVFVIMIFSTLAGIISMKIYFRRKLKKNYVLISAFLYSSFCLIIGVNTLLTQTVESVIGLSLIIISFLFYTIEKKLIFKN